MTSGRTVRCPSGPSRISQCRPDAASLNTAPRCHSPSKGSRGPRDRGVMARTVDGQFGGQTLHLAQELPGVKRRVITECRNETADSLLVMFS